MAKINTTLSTHVGRPKYSRLRATFEDVENLNKLVQLVAPGKYGLQGKVLSLLIANALTWAQQARDAHEPAERIRDELLGPGTLDVDG